MNIRNTWTPWRGDGSRTSTDVSCVRVKTKTRSKNSSRLETRSSTSCAGPRLGGELDTARNPVRTVFGDGDRRLALLVAMLNALEGVAQRTRRAALDSLD